MKPSTFDLIRRLTATDKKTLTQKTLKTVEEVGELAKVVLPFENAYATTHRFVDRERILEEVADALLCVLSVGYDLGATDDEIDEVINRKAIYWADLQAREVKAKYPVPYEIHVTVRESFVEDFRKKCEEIGVKPILLDLHTQNDGVIKDLMTSSVHIGDNRTAYAEMKRISDALAAGGYFVCREKIETIPWHPSAPSARHQNPKMPPNCYFESHLNIVCTEERQGALRAVAQGHGAKLSRNVFKKLDGDKFMIMMTLRISTGTAESFNEKLDALKHDLGVQGFEIGKTIVEFSVYDTKVSHDAAWISGEAK
jgi:NTP pyrophosphatase (non-canonical NTP hydrolase)